MPSKPSRTAVAARKAKRPRQRTYAALKRDLDRQHSKWTRARFATNGMVQCVSCGQVLPVNSMQAGHFVSRSYLSTRWHPENVAPQCFQCNVFKKGNLAAYAAWGVNRYGQDWPARMVALSRTETKLTRTDLTTMIEDYEKRITEISQSPIVQTYI